MAKTTTPKVTPPTFPFHKDGRRIPNNAIFFPSMKAAARLLKFCEQASADNFELCCNCVARQRERYYVEVFGCVKYDVYHGDYVDLFIFSVVVMVERRFAAAMLMCQRHATFLPPYRQESDLWQSQNTVPAFRWEQPL